jgi:hypothetical protein
MDDVSAAAERRLYASAFSAAEDGLTDEQIFDIVRRGIDESRRMQAVRAASTDQPWGWGSEYGHAA